jgi:hypothetical protein
MMRALEEAIERLRELPEQEQHAAAMAVFAYLTADDRNDQLIADENAGAPRMQVEG